MSIQVEFTSQVLDSTYNIIKEWNELKTLKKQSDLDSPEWKKLESAYSEHLLWRFKYPKRVFGHQLITNWLITVTILALVISGVIFSFLQLQYAMKVGDLSSLATKIDLQTAGRISMNSSIIGALTLVISLLFFALYLKHVFDIKHPIPPHVSLAETDAHTLRGTRKGSTPASRGMKSAVEKVRLTGIHKG